MALEFVDQAGAEPFCDVGTSRQPAHIFNRSNPPILSRSGGPAFDFEFLDAPSVTRGGWWGF